jgi:KDO2-lipid IV(A) lauroyltransferase
VPLAAAYWVADRCGDLAYVLCVPLRRNVADNLGQVLGPGASARQVEWVVRRVFRTSARNLVDLLRVPHVSPEELARSVQVCPGRWAEFERLAAAGQGVLLVTAHLGPFDIVGQVLTARRYPFITLTRRTVPVLLDVVVHSLRTSHGLRIEPESPGAIRRMLEALRRGELVGLVADWDGSRSGAPVVFFGRETTLPAGPVRLARATGAPILAAFARRLQRGYQLMLEPPFYVERTGDAVGDLRAGLQRLVELFERHIREAPEQWVIFQRVWPDRLLAAHPRVLGAPALAAGPLGQETGASCPPVAS